ncbi:MAG: quinone-dependent dihydroorotate dehydrogenase [Rhodospirillaceae bacterium]|jgi:dihydroorotate dehydrogenase|nr:quinone-dependent dihydroorotate dehydrogenase [Rhodospirillaceae bacterium]MBT5564579.1 quinone-dependent dihydroorotate dehydrogenase [Rhodospirillaceae bacterium]MBT6090914.1 quinone-dependent dihydroorotate dehydrogenase [Rhodospirillaceae bacterium]MBT6962200.1 quinone-dependent dihydroorotate dehydrogenase [Rhodospirillaceae bacterium]
MPNFYPLIRPFLWVLDAEVAHGLALSALRAVPGWCLPFSGEDDGLETTVWGRSFSNPLGLAAGFDKHAQASSALYRLGFGFVEVGGVTLQPQPGNPKPRLFRLAADQAVINRMGLNSVGAEVVARNLSQHRQKVLPGPLAVNIGLNKDATDPPSDYGALARTLAPYSEILTINVSSPNTPGLRALQDPSKLMAIVNSVREAAETAPETLHPTVLVKIAPDLESADVADICDLAVRENFDGLVVSNTTVARPQTLQSPNSNEAGGLSGRPLFESSTALLRDVYFRTAGKIPLVGVGGVSSAADAYEKIKAGASLIQLYSALIFEGPALVGKIKTDLAQMLRADGFATVAEAIGVDHRLGGGR